MTEQEKARIDEILDKEIYPIQEEAIYRKILQRRRQILIHSYLYYELNETLVDDSKWSQWAKELVWLQNTYPELAQRVMYYSKFKDFDASTGFDFTYPDEIKDRAVRLLREREDRV